MSLAIAIQTREGIVIASDSRGTFGDPRSVTGANDTIRKVYGLTKYTAIAIAGANEIGATLLDKLIPQIKNRHLEGIDDVLQVTYQFFRDQYNEWFPNLPPMPSPQAPHLQRPGLVAILSGYRISDNKPDQPMIFTIMSQLGFVPCLSNYGFAIIGVPQYAIYLLNRLYSQDMSLRSAIELAAYCISETATQDGKVGGPVQIAEITITKGFRAYQREEIERIVEENKKQNQSLRGLFFKK
jgi:20S proteasome alpha/beta subunit